MGICFDLIYPFKVSFCQGGKFRGHYKDRMVVGLGLSSGIDGKQTDLEHI